MSRLVRLILLAVAAVLVVALAVHLPLVRNAARDRLAAGISSMTGAHVTFDALDYNVFSLAVAAHGVRVARPGHDQAPFFEAERVAVDLGWRSLGRTWQIDAVEIDLPRLHVDELRRFLDARPSPPPGAGGTALLDAVSIKRLAVAGLEAMPDAEAAVALDLRGLSLAMSRETTGALTGTITLAQRSTVRVGAATTAIDRLAGRLALAGSRLTVSEFRVAGPDLRASLDGEITQLDATPQLALSVSGRVSAGLVAALDPRVPIAGGALNVSLEVNGTAPSLTTQVAVTTDQLVLTDASSATVTATGRLAGARLRLESAELTACGGTLSLTADVALGAGTAHDAGEVRWTGVDVAHALRLVESASRGTGRTSSRSAGPSGQATRSAAGRAPRQLSATTSGRATFTGPLDRVPELRAALTATLASGANGPGPLLGGRLDGRLEAGQWHATVADARLGAMRIDARGGGRAAPTWSQSTLAGDADADAADLPTALGQLAALGIDTSAIAPAVASGQARAHARLGGSVSEPTMDAVVEVGRLRLTAAPGTYTLSGGVRADRRGVSIDDLRVTGGANRAEGRVHVSRAGRLDGEFAATVDDLVTPGAALPAAWRPRGGRLRISGRASGTTERPQVAGTVTASDIVVAGQQVDAATASVALAGHDLLIERLEVASRQGRLTAGGTYDLHTRLLAVDAISARDYPLRPVPADPGAREGRLLLALSGTADLDASLRGPLDATTGNATFRVRDARWGEEPVGDVAGRLSATEGVVGFDLRNDASGASATGTVGPGPAWPIKARLAVRDGDVAHLVRLAASPQLSAASPSGRADAVVALSGELADTDTLAIDLSVSAASLVVYGLPISVATPASLRVRGNTVLDAAIEVTSGTSRARVTRQSAAAPVAIAIDGDLRDASALLPLINGARLVAAGPVRAHVTIPDLDRLTETEGEISCQGCSAQPAGMPPLTDITLAAHVAAGRLTVDTARARWGDATATATGSAPLAFAASWLPGDVAARLPRASGPAEVRVSLAGVSASLARDVLGSDALQRLEGVVDLSLTARAEAPRLDAVTGEGTITRAFVQLGDVRLGQDEPAVLEFEGERLALRPWRLSGGGTELTIAAGAEFDGVEPVYETRIDGRVNLRAFNALAPGQRVAGIADVHVSARGHPTAVVWSGRVDLADGAIVQRAQRLAIVDVDAALALSGDQVTIERLTGRLNGGTVDAHGTVQLHAEGLEGRVTGTVRGAGIEMPPGTRHDVDADLQLTLGATREVSGTVTLVPGTVRESLVGLAALVDQFGPDPMAAPARTPAEPSQPIALNLALTTADDLVFDSNDLRLSAFADLTITGTVDRPVLLGQVRARDDGELFLLGRTWKLDASAVNFVRGAGGTELRLAITGDTRIGGYEVQMRITGPPDRLAMSLNSDPPLGRSDLTELVMTGGVSSGDSTRKGGQQVATAISAEVLGTVGRVVGLDTVRIEQNGDELSTFDIEPVSRLTIGERIGEFFEVIYSQSLGQTNDVAWILVYRPGWRGLEARFTYRTNAAESYEVRQELYFGGPGRRAQPRARRAPAPRVVDLVITGVDASDAASLRALVRMRPGRRFDARDWQADEVRVTRYFRDRDRLLARVRASRSTDASGVTLRYDITPGPLARIAVEGYQVNAATLDAMRATWARVVLEEFLDEDLARPLRLQLARDGYFQPEIATRFQALPSGEGRLASVRVAPGPRAGRRELLIAGNEAVSTADLRKAIEASCRRLRCWVEPAVLPPPLQALYRTRGHLGARVTARRPSLDGNTATLRVDIDEGRRFLVGPVTVTGAAVLGRDAALQAFGLATGSPYAPADATAAADRLRTTYYRAGFRSAEVTAVPSVDLQTASVGIDVRVDEGARSVLEAVDVAGRFGVRQSLLESVMRLPQTGVLDSVALDDAQQRLYDTGIFRSVDVAVEPVEMGAALPDIDQPVRAVFTLEERPRYRLRYGVQYGPTNIQDNTIAQERASLGVTADLHRRNLFGRGVNAGVGGFWSPEQYEARATANATTFFGRFVNTTFTAATADQSQIVNSGGLLLLDHSDRAVLEQRWRRGRDRRIEFAYGYEFDSRRIGIQLGRLAEELIRASAAGLTGTFAYDARDNVFNPRKGWYHSSRLEGGPEGWLSDISFVRYQAQQYAYFALGPAVFASGVRFGTLDVNDELKYASILLRFKAGGSTTVRGYAQDSLSPLVVQGVPFGGNVLLIFNEELRFPLYRWFGAAAFADLGNTFESLQTFSWDGLKLGTGIGFRFNTPVFVIRIDAGFPVPREPGGPRMRWYFAIGQAF